ncbi:MAG: aminotransferase class I/II-fold pyridoxal phosphate-dependent enzyme [Acidimicrobiia bacterium]
MSDRPVLSPARLASRMASINPFRVVDVMEQAWAAEAAGRKIVHLEVGEPDFGTPAPVAEAATRAMTDGRVRYTSSLGLPALREAISGYYATRFGLDVPARRIVVTMGASGALLLALAATVDRDDEILLSDPGYPCNRNLIRMFEGRPRPLPVGAPSNYQLTAGLVEEHWDERTRGVLLATPSNPTGTVVLPGELGAITGLVAARGGIGFVDEIYGELVYDTPPVTVLAEPDTDACFVINSFSKTFGMTGWRLGWLVCPEWALRAIEILAQNAYISPPVPAQYGAFAAFSEPVWAEVAERREAFHRRRDLLVGGLRDIGFSIPVMPQGAFYVYAGSSAFSPDSFELAGRILTEAGVAVGPGMDFGEHGAAEHLRFSYTTSLDQISLGLERLAAYLPRAASPSSRSPV